MAYSVNPTQEQDSITEFLRSEYPNMAIIPDGLPDDDYDEITYNAQGEMNTFVVLWYSNIKPGRAKGFGGRKLDSYFATVDVVVVARDGDRARVVLNDITDRLIDFKAEGGGRLTQGKPLFSDARNLRRDTTRPARWIRTSRFDFGVASKKTP